MEIKLSEVQSDISRLDSKIEREIANLLATYERYRNDVIRYAAGGVGVGGWFMFVESVVNGILVFWILFGSGKNE